MEERILPLLTKLSDGLESLEERLLDDVVHLDPLTKIPTKSSLNDAFQTAPVVVDEPLEGPAVTRLGVANPSLG